MARKPPWNITFISNMRQFITLMKKFKFKQKWNVSYMIKLICWLIMIVNVHVMLFVMNWCFCWLNYDKYVTRNHLFFQNKLYKIAYKNITQRSESSWVFMCKPKFNVVLQYIKITCTSKYICRNQCTWQTPTRC